MQKRALKTCSLLLFIATIGFVSSASVAVAQNASPVAAAQQTDRPWMNPQLSPEERADLVLKRLTLDEKIALLHGNGMAHDANWQAPLTPLTNGGAG
jgi:beta-glucosidase